MFSDLTLYRNLHSTTIRDREFAVPQFGYCEEISGPPSWRPRLLQCRAALRRPTAVVVDSPNNDYEARRFLSEFGISPIVSFAATFNPEDKELVTGEPVSRILQPYDL